MKPVLTFTKDLEKIFIYEAETHFIESKTEIKTLPQTPKEKYPRTNDGNIDHAHKDHDRIRKLHTDYNKEHHEQARFVKPYWDAEKIKAEYVTTGWKLLN